MRAAVLALACAVVSAGSASAQEVTGSASGADAGTALSGDTAAGEVSVPDVTDLTREDRPRSFDPFTPRGAADTFFGASPVGRLGSGLAPNEAGLFVGSPVQPGGLGAPLGPPPGLGLAPGQSYAIRPSVGVQQLYTDNLFNSRNNKQDEFITTISPSVYLAADTARLRGSLAYLPTFAHYANTSGQDRLDHRFAGSALATLLPGSFYLSLNGSADTRTATGGFTPEGTTVVDRRNNVQTFNVQASPYYVQRFGGWATAIVGYAYGHGSTSGNDAFLPGTQQRFFTSQSYNSNQLFGVLRSGENLGRVALEGRASGTTYEGTGVLDGAHRSETSVQALYAITRNIAGFVEGGYENQRYAGTPRVEISGPIWSVGARLRPNEDSVVIARYGRRDGYNSAALEAQVSVGPRTRLVATYQDRLTTSTRRGNDLLSSAALDESGYPLSRGDVFSPGSDSSGFSGNPFLATQGGLLRVKRAALAISRSFTRDVVTLSAFREEQVPVASTLETTVFSQKATSGSLAWAHELTPEMTAIGYVQYGTYSSGSRFGSGSNATASATLVRRFTPQLSGSVQYAISRRDRDDNVANGGVSIQNLVLVSLRQDF